jgi:hypothetical protein
VFDAHATGRQCVFRDRRVRRRVLDEQDARIVHGKVAFTIDASREPTERAPG